MKKYLLMMLTMLLVSTGAAYAQDFAQTKEIKFARGKNSATVTGTLASGDEDMTYSLGARAGQRMQIVFTASSPKFGYSVSSDSGDLLIGKKTAQTVTLTDTGTQIINIHALNVPGATSVRNIRYTLKVTIL